MGDSTSVPTCTYCRGTGQPNGVKGGPEMGVCGYCMGSGTEDGNLWPLRASVSIGRLEPYTDSEMVPRSDYASLEASLAERARELDEERAGHAAARENFHTAQNAANTLRIRAEAADARLAEAERVLEPFATYIQARDKYDADLPDGYRVTEYAPEFDPVVRVTFGEFRAAARALNRQTASQEERG